MASRIFGAIAAIVAAASPTMVNAAAPARCDFWGFVADPDRTGTNLRAAPSRNAAVLAHLPHSQPGDEELAPEVRVIGFRDGWAEVGEAIFADYGSGADRILFKGRGWLWGGLLSTSLNHPNLRSGPNERAPVVARLMGEDWGPDGVEVLAIDDCLGAFARIRGKLPDGKLVSGWTDGLCSNQVTTCP